MAATRIGSKIHMRFHIAFAFWESRTFLPSGCRTAAHALLLQWAKAALVSTLTTFLFESDSFVTDVYLVVDAGCVLS